MSSPTRVIIVGCGIAGPVLGTFLKLKGYHPVIYERMKRDTDGGLSMMLQANGLRVLSLIPGLISKLPGKAVDRLAIYSTVPGDEDLLAEGIPSAEIEPTDSEYESGKRPGIGIGVRRHEFLHLLSETALNAGVEIHWERMVTDVQQDPESDSVTVTLVDGTTDTASFVVGCDGLHSNTRISLFGKEEATFTGVSQMGGFSPTPKSTAMPTMIDFFGEGMHMITYPVSETKSSWAIARRDVETRETWRAVDDSRLEELKDDPVALWPFGSGDLLKGAEKIIKYGLYDRPELKTWYRDRVVLLGDAAHPTTPHLGQGANQSMEDIYQLVRVLVKHNPSAEAPSTEVLKRAFSEYERIRLPHTAALVKEARRMGELRVTDGKEECLKRNNMLREIWGDTDKAMHDFAMRTAGPWKGQSEI